MNELIKSKFCALRMKTNFQSQLNLRTKMIETHLKFWFFCIFVLSVLKLSASSDVKCGVRSQSRGFIVGGSNFRRGDFPWMVALLYTRHDPPSYFCGATLISAKNILTGKGTLTSLPI